MIIKQFFDDFIAHSSYLLGSDSVCAIIDPRRDTDIYIKEAKKLDLKIKYIMETHLHADFISGHLDLADKTGATIYGPQKAGFQFGHSGLKEGDIIEFEDIKIKVIETPGHTPEMINYIAYDSSRNKKDPIGVFTGDTLFVGDVGRPDLFPGMLDELTEKLFSSLKNKIFKLPDYTEIYPAHGSGSLCGGEIGSKRTSTIRFEKNNNKLLKTKKLEDFKKLLFLKQLPVPDHFHRCSDINKNGPKLLKNLSELTALNIEEAINKVSGQKNFPVCDIRSYDAYGSQHIPGSINIDFNGVLGNYAGWFLPFDKEIIIISESTEQAEIAHRVFRRSGIDTRIYFLNKGMDIWSFNGLPTAHIPQINPEEFRELAGSKMNVTILDVRNSFEYDSGHIKNAINIPVHELRTRFNEISKENPVIVYCGSGKRSGLASSILEFNGFRHLYNLAGGFYGYLKTG